jgi:hypothetical protein
MLDELIWNVETYRALIVGVIFFTLSVVVAWKVIPLALERERKKREKRLVKELLREWGGDCERAIVLAMPSDVRKKWLQTEEDGDIVGCNSGFRFYDIVNQIWKDIREGERQPEGSAKGVKKAVHEVMYSDEEKKGQRTLVERDPKYQLKNIFGRERELPTAFISRILNTIYAKLEILELKNLPIIELEGARDHLDFFENKKIIRSQIMLYVDKVAKSMEMFGIYLWKLENWSEK